MDLTSPKTIKNLLSSHGARPSKGLGQNFLINEKALREIIEAADLQPDDTVLEIGPGLGVLTKELAGEAKKVIAVEKDPKMVEILGETLKDYKNVEIIQGDIRKFDFQKTPSKVVGNLPFYLTAHIIRQFLELAETRSPQMTLMVQKEVAQKICAKPPDMNLLAVSVQFYAEPKIISYVSKKSFWPSPEVDAAIIKIRSTKHEIRNNVDKSLFFKIVKAGFSQPRKQLINNLSKGLEIDKKKVGEWLLENGIQPSQRAETLSLEDWTKLAMGAYNVLLTAHHGDTK